MMPSQSSPDLSLAGRADIAGKSAAWIMTHLQRILCVGIAGALLLKFVLIWRIAVNWDEFYFLEMVHQYARGELAIRFQTFHVHLFSWLPGLGWETVDQVIAGRFIMALLATGSAALIYGIARRFVGRAGALFVVLSYLSVTAVVQHGASFRVDPIVTVLVLLSLFAVLCKPAGWRGAALAGVAMALALSVTIKSAIYLIVLGGVFWCAGPAMRERIRLGSAFGVSLLLGLAALRLFHDSQLPAQPAAGAGDFLQSTASKVFLDEIFPRSFDLIQMVLANPLLWIMMIEGAVVAWAIVRARAGQPGWQRLLPLVLALPVLTPIFYRNAFDYFYPVIFAPAAVLVGFSFEKHLKSAPRPNGVPVAAILVVAQCALLVFNAASAHENNLALQRRTIADVRAVIPQPVAHIEGFGAFPDYQRVGFFMSSWGVESYRRAGRPIFADLVAKDQPVFVFADSPSLYHALVPGIDVATERTFLAEDIRVLQDNYIHHWGMLFVAGKRIEVMAGETGSFDIMIAGEYRLEAAAPATIDGGRVAPNGIVTLAAGAHTIALDGGSRDATLRWAKASHRPAPPAADPLAFFDRNSWAGMTPDMMRPDGAR